MFNIGGKITDHFCNNLLTVFDYEYNEWYTVNGPECFRHVAWIHEGKIFIHGGFGKQNRMYQKGEIVSFSLLEVFKPYPKLVSKIQAFIREKQNGSVTPSPPIAYQQKRT